MFISQIKYHFKDIEQSLSQNNFQNMQLKLI